MFDWIGALKHFLLYEGKYGISEYIESKCNTLPSLTNIGITYIQFNGCSIQTWEMFLSFFYTTWGNCALY